MLSTSYRKLRLSVRFNKLNAVGMRQHIIFLHDILRWYRREYNRLGHQVMQDKRILLNINVCVTVFDYTLHLRWKEFVAYR